MFRVWILPAMAMCCAVPWGVMRLCTRTPVRQAATEATFFGYLAAMFYVVFAPLPWRPQDTRLVSSSVNLVPGRTVVEIVRTFRELVAFANRGREPFCTLPIQARLPGGSASKSASAARRDKG